MKWVFFIFSEIRLKFSLNKIMYFEQHTIWAFLFYFKVRLNTLAMGPIKLEMTKQHLYIFVIPMLQLHNFVSKTAKQYNDGFILHHYFWVALYIFDHLGFRTYHEQG